MSDEISLARILILQQRILLLLAGLATFCMSTVYSLSQEDHDCISHLVATNPSQLSVQEYSLIAETLLRKAPCNMLVFGVGMDSALWIRWNAGGTTLFLEDNKIWLKRIQKQIPNIQAYLVEYLTLRSQWKDLLTQDHLLYMELPQQVLETQWDIIFVDAPAGYDDTKPGRMKSIYMAALLAFQQKRPVDIFVHDCDREVEAVYCSQFLKDEHLKEAIDRLRHYAISQ